MEGDKKMNCEIMIINSLTRESKGMNIFRKENDINDHNMIGWTINNDMKLYKSYPFNQNFTI